MKLTLDTNEITREDFSAILDIVYGAAPKDEAAPTPKKRATKKEAPSTSAPEEKPTTEKGIAIEDLRALVAKKVWDSREEIKAKLSEFEAKNVSTLAVKHWADFKAFLEEL